MSKSEGDSNYAQQILAGLARRKYIGWEADLLIQKDGMHRSEFTTISVATVKTLSFSSSDYLLRYSEMRIWWNGQILPRGCNLDFQ